MVIFAWVTSVFSGLQAPQPDASEQPKKFKKEKGSKKKGKKAEIGFASLPEGGDDELPAVSEEASQALPPHDAKQGKKSSTAAVSFADDGSDGEAAQPVADSDDEATVSALKSKKAKKGGKKAAVTFANPSDDGGTGGQSRHPSAETNGSLAESDEETPLQLSGKKKKKSKKSSFVMPAEFEGDSTATGAVFPPSRIEYYIDGHTHFCRLLD